MQSTNTYLVIMAGGIGSRFWPLSTVNKPKQFLDILNEGRTMIQATAERFAGIVPQQHIMVVTSQHYHALVREQLPYLSDNQILLEPCMRNTAPCIAWAVWKIAQGDPDANIIVAPSDHVITNETEFRKVIQQGVDFVSQHNALLTLGIQPNRPETGYGYILIDSQTSTTEPANLDKVAAFVEKPNLEKAQYYLESGNYCWNAGIFLWNAQTIISAFNTYQPAIASIFDQAAPVWNTPEESKYFEMSFPDCPNISIDYAILEKADNIYVKTAAFGWSDLGTWGSLHELSVKDENKNQLNGRISLYETTNSVIIAPPNKRVIVQGLDNYIVADTPDALLICRKDQEQRIKEFVK